MKGRMCLRETDEGSQAGSSASLVLGSKLVNGVLFFATVRSADQDAVLALCSSFGDLRVEMNDVQRLTPFAIPMLWPSIAHRVITRVQAAFAVEAKSDSERHRMPHQSRCEPLPPLIACVTSSSTVSERDIS